MNRDVDCAPAFPSEAAAVEVAGPSDEACNSGPLAVLASQLAAQPKPAGIEACVAAGRAQVQFSNGAVRWTSSSQPIALLELIDHLASLPECTPVLQLPASDRAEGCRTTLDCAARDGGVECMPSPTCAAAGQCESYRREGQKCGILFPPCESGLACGTALVCSVPALLDEPCNARPCAPGLVCNSSGVCKSPLPLGAICSRSGQCQEPLVCNGTCVEPDAGTGTCGGARDCAPCQTCFNGACLSHVPLNGDCSNAPCSAGLVCTAQARCAYPSAAGAPCVPVGTFEDGSLQGSCVRTSDACPYVGCDGGPCEAECTPRGTAGSPCIAPPAGYVSRGTCAAGLWCSREAATTRTGSCLPRQGLGAGCSRDASRPLAPCLESLRCRQAAPDAGFHCLAEPASDNGYCVDTTDCALGSQCRANGLLTTTGGLCGPGPQAAEQCSTSLVPLGHGCAPDLYCDGMSCSPLLGEMAACTSSPMCSTGGCIGGMCGAPLPPGSECAGLEPFDECQGGFCMMGRCLNQACTALPSDTFGSGTLYEVLARFLFLG